MFKYVVTAAAVTLLSVPAYAAQDAMPPAAKVETAVPANAVTVTDWYKQDVYDPNDNKIGQIKDVLVDKSGKIHSLVIGVGGFLGAGEKDVLVAFDAVQPTMKDRKMYLVMNTTKDSLKAAPGFKYDSDHLGARQPQCQQQDEVTDLQPRGPGRRPGPALCVSLR